MTQLSQSKCVACRGGEPTLTASEIYALQPQVPEWQVKQVEGVDRIQRSYEFKDFAAALRFTNQVGEIAELEDHHPRIVTEWGRVTLEWWTHKIGGLHRNDFIMAAKSDSVYSDRD